MRHWLTYFCLMSLLWLSTGLRAEEITHSVPDIFEITTTSLKFDPKAPWNSSFESAVGSGFLVAGKHILTNAHVVENATFITIRSNAAPHWYEAEVVAIAHEVDLALLTVKDESFLKDKKPIPLGELPDLGQTVTLYGYPAGGNHLSVTRGVVSRIEYRPYRHSELRYQSIQVDAAINVGNSGGPAIVDGKIVGMVMETDSSYENTGYLIPVPLIRQFLTDMDDGKQAGFPWLTVYFQVFSSPQLKAYYQLKPDQSGVVVRSICSGTDAARQLAAGDVITHIDDKVIADNGLVKDGVRFMDFQHYVDVHQLGDTLNLTILRQGKTLQVPVRLDRRVNYTPQDTAPRYFIFGGFVFGATTQTDDCVLTTGLEAPEDAEPTIASRDKIDLILVLRSMHNIGYHTISPFNVQRMNNQEVSDFKTFYELLFQGKEPLIVLEDNSGDQVIIDRELALAEQSELLKRYRIAKAASEEFDRAP